MGETPQQSGGADVRARRVLYVHGFDPRGPSAYHRMFKAESVSQGVVDGGHYAVSDRRTLAKGVAGWHVRADEGGAVTETTYGVLRWDDVVRGLWARGEIALWREMLSWVRDFRRSGAFRYAHRGARPGYWAMMTPPLVVADLVGSTVLAMILLGWGGAWAAPQLGVPGWAGWLAGLAPLALAPGVWRAIDKAWNISWLSRCFAFIALAPRGSSPALIARADQFAGEIIAACEERTCDEVLVVGHSQGTPVAIMALARALRQNPDLGREGPRLSFLTLGQSISIWSHLAPGAGGFHQDVATVRDAAQVFWLDVTSPSDSVSACGISPLDVVGEGDGNRPARRSPQFHQMLSRRKFRRIRLRPFEYHFQYLCASERANAYSYFRLTCGPDFLSDFHQGWTVAIRDDE
jgi:hypothetical protein